MSDDFKDLLSQMDDEEPEGERGFADLLGGGLPEAPAGASGGGGLADLLGGLLGGGAAGGASSGDASSGDMGDMAGMLGGLLGGGGAAAGASGGGGLMDLLGGLLGGGGAPTGASGASGGGLSDLLGGLLGGGGQPMTFGGGGGPTLPFANTLAEKLGISPQMANMLIMGAIGLLTASAAKKRSSGRSGDIDLNSLAADPDYIRSSGVAARLSAQMGISEDEAVAGLQQTMGLMAAGQNPPAKKTGARKTTAKKTTGQTAPKKKSTAKATKTTAKKKPSGSNTGSDFMDLLDDPH